MNIFNKNITFISYLLIVIAVIAANLYPVFGLDILLLDDNARYFSFSSDDYNLVLGRRFIGFVFLLKWIGVYLFSTYSIETARLFILLTYMVPVSCLFFHINHKIFKLPLWVSLASAVIVNIIPQQFVIPAFLDGSYPVPGMLFFLITLLVTNHYLDKGHFKFSYFVIASLCWLLVCDLIAELGIFLFPVLFLFILSSSADLRRKLYLFATTLIFTTLRIYFYLLSQGKNPSNKVSEHDLSLILERISLSIDWWFPFAEGSAISDYLFIALAIIVIFSVTLTIRSYNSQKIYNRAYLVHAALFVSCSFPFWFLSKYFSTRYFYVSYFGLTTITFMAIYHISLFIRPYRKVIGTLTLLILFAFYGVQRYRLNETFVSQRNKKNTGIKALLKQTSINDTTQIALVNIKNGTGGYYQWSSGYLRYLMRKPGISGIMGNDRNFYDPFNKKQCSYSFKMSCLDVTKELIAFKMDLTTYTSSRMYYFLQWLTPEDKESRWLLYKSGEGNNLSLVEDGEGLLAYRQALDERGINSKRILWGNLEDQKALEKLH